MSKRVSSMARSRKPATKPLRPSKEWSTSKLSAAAWAVEGEAARLWNSGIDGEYNQDYVCGAY